LKNAGGGAITEAAGGPLVEVSRVIAVSQQVSEDSNVSPPPCLFILLDARYDHRVSVRVTPCVRHGRSHLRGCHLPAGEPADLHHRQQVSPTFSKSSLCFTRQLNNTIGY
jgi:hypothetical protein